VFESAHVTLKFLALVAEVGTHQLSEVLPKVADRFSPLFVGDHMVAVGCWMLFYVIEAAAIMSVLKSFPDDPEAAQRAAKNVVTLPKKMLPLRSTIFKHLLRQKGSLTPATSAAATASFAAPRAPQPAPHTSSAFVDKDIPTAVPGDAGSVATLPRPAPRMGGSSTKQRKADLKDDKQNPEGKEKTDKDTDEPSTLAGLGQLDQISSPVTRPNKGKDGVPLAEPINQRLLDKKRKEKGLKPGEWDPNTSLLARRMNELKGRRAYLKNFWYAAAISEEVKEAPVGVELCGEKIVLFRGKDGQVRCLNDVCPHRGAPLSKGWVNTVDGHECVVCPYHGWAFDGEGVLRDVPAAEHVGEWPQKQLVDAYPVQEKGGFVWLFYGSKSLPADERPPIPYVPELDDPAWKPVYGSIEFDCNHWSVFENAIDMAHIHYLHSDSFGNQGQPQIRDMTCTHDAYGVTAKFGLHNKPVNKLWEFSQVPIVNVTAKALLPSTSVIAFTLGNGLSFTTFVNTVPVNANKTINRFSLIRKLDADKLGIFNMNAWDRFARQAMIKILSEDKAMVEELRPDLLPREISVKADLPQIAFRKLRQEYIDMGYGVAPETVEKRYTAPDL
jgi:phenylpropionate dioxygenase-like ring-hydroxylating dioxygenase large terminal subunit